MSGAAEEIALTIAGWRASAPGPLVVAIDGHGAAGKTTIASEVALAIDAIVLHTDDFFHEATPTADPRPMAQYYDWDALRLTLTRCLERTRQGGEPARSAGSQAILVEGVSAAAPALADLVVRTVFVATPEPVRLARLRGRISPEEWDEEWLRAEREYFASRPPESFDLVVSGCTGDGCAPTITS